MYSFHSITFTLFCIYHFIFAHNISKTYIFLYLALFLFHSSAMILSLHNNMHYQIHFMLCACILRDLHNAYQRKKRSVKPYKHDS